MEKEKKPDEVALERARVKRSDAALDAVPPPLTADTVCMRPDFVSRRTLKSCLLITHAVGGVGVSW